MKATACLINRKVSREEKCDAGSGTVCAFTAIDDPKVKRVNFLTEISCFAQTFSLIPSGHRIFVRGKGGLQPA
jgi:hypothetical protein